MKIFSTDGKRQISVEEFDRIADSGSDEIDAFLDWNKGKRGGARPLDGSKCNNPAILDQLLKKLIDEG